MSLIFKTIDLKLIDVDDQKGIVKGYFSSFGNIDAVKDTIQQGAYSKTIKEWGPNGKSRIKYLWMHDTNQPIGKLLELYEDEIGEVFTAKLSVNTTKGRDAYEFYKDGVITEHSVGIDVIKSDYDPDKSLRTIKEVRQYEGSAVMWGADENTPTTNIKALNQYISRVNETLHKNDRLTDESFVLLEKTLLNLQNTLKQMAAAQNTDSKDEQIKLLKYLEKNL
jgi:uncharacterized protein